MPIFTWNIYEKNFTPYWASLAPKQHVHSHVRVQKPCTLSAYQQSSYNKTFWRSIRRHILHRNWRYYFCIMLCGLINSRLGV